MPFYTYEVTTKRPINFLKSNDEPYLEMTLLFVIDLSAASKMTLVHQGGPMSAKEASQFESGRYFSLLLEMRRWDEAAKVQDMQIQPLQKYEEMFINILLMQHNKAGN